MALIGIVRFWDSWIHCWRIGNVRCEDMKRVMTLFEDDHGGYGPPWSPAPSSCSGSVRIKGYSVVVSCLLRHVHLMRLCMMSVTAVAGVMVSVATLTHPGGQSVRALWVAADSDAVGGAHGSSNEHVAAHCHVLLEWGDTIYPVFILATAKHDKIHRSHEYA